MTQIKKVQSLIGEASERAKLEMKETGDVRHKHLVMIGNTLHPSVPISNDEVSEWVGQWGCGRDHCGDMWSLEMVADNPFLAGEEQG